MMFIITSVTSVVLGFVLVSGCATRNLLSGPPAWTYIRTDVDKL